MGLSHHSIFFWFFIVKRIVIQQTSDDKYKTGLFGKESNVPSPITDVYSQDKILTVETSTCYVYKSIFDECKSSTPGGAISAQDITVKLYIDSTDFRKCSSIEKGGAIAIDDGQSNSACVIIFVCAISCTAQYAGQFNEIYLDQWSYYDLNVVSQSAVTNAYSSTGSETLHLAYGVFTVELSNVTNCYCSRNSGLKCDSPKKPDADHNVVYVTFKNNTGTEGCVYFAETNQKLDKCNIIGNGQTSSSFGIIMIEGAFTLNILSCCINENNFESGYLFYAKSKSTINVKEGNFIQQNSNSEGTVQFSDLNDQSFFNAFPFIETGECKISTEFVKTSLQPPVKTYRTVQFFKNQFHFFSELYRIIY